eukprot:1459758-Rhodomonas_salina.1
MACCQCRCPVNSSTSDTGSCRNGRSAQVNPDARSDGAPSVKCCRCANLPCNESCLFCIDQVRKEVADVEKEKAVNKKRKASEELTKTNQELDSECKEQEATRGKIQSIQNSIKELKQKQERLEQERRALDSCMEVAKRKLAELEQDAESRRQKIEDLKSNKKRRKTEELEAIRKLGEMDKLLLPSSSKSYPGYWNVTCNADAAQSAELSELEPAERTRFEGLIKTCTHRDCNLPHVRDCEVLQVRRIENETQWDIYHAKKRKLVRKLREANGGVGTGSSSGGAAPSAARVHAPPAVEPPLLTGRVLEFCKEECWDPEARDAFLFHGVQCEEAAIELGNKGLARGKKERLGPDATSLTNSAKLRPTQTKKQGRRVQPGQVAESLRDARRAPRKCGCSEDCNCGKYHDSVVAQTNANVDHGSHREIVVYDPDLVYPEYMIVLGDRSTCGLSDAPQAAPAAKESHCRFCTPCSCSCPFLPSIERQSVLQSVMDDVKAIVGEMEKNKASDKAQEKGCIPLSRLPFSQTNQAIIVGAAETVLGAMSKHGASAGVQEQGCRALNNLAADDDNRAKIGAMGGIEAVMKGMQEHGASAGVQRQPCCLALGNCACTKDVKIGAMGGIEAVLGAMSKHGASAGVQEQGCRALHQLAANHDNCAKIGAMGGIEAWSANTGQGSSTNFNKIDEIQGCSGSALLHAYELDGAEAAGSRVWVAAHSGQLVSQGPWSAHLHPVGIPTTECNPSTRSRNFLPLNLAPGL